MLDQKPTYQVEIHVHAARDLRSLPSAALSRVQRKIDALAHNPRPKGCKKLQGTEHTYRVRIGDYRILYEVNDARLLVVVVRVGHRREIYGRG